MNELNIKVIFYIGDDSWVEKTIHEAIDCFKGDRPPPARIVIFVNTDMQ